MLIPRGKARLVLRTADTSRPLAACNISEFSSVEGRPEANLDSSPVGTSARRGSGDGSPSAVYKSECETDAGKDWCVSVGAALFRVAFDEVVVADDLLLPVVLRYFLCLRQYLKKLPSIVNCVALLDAALPSLGSPFPVRLHLRTGMASPPSPSPPSSRKSLFSMMSLRQLRRRSMRTRKHLCRKKCWRCSWPKWTPPRLAWLAQRVT